MRQRVSAFIVITLVVSIHAPREGCDAPRHAISGTPPRFNSRTPGGVRLKREHRIIAQRLVSIHAPREGCDTTTHVSRTSSSRFQFTHPGRGATRSASASSAITSSFNSRTPGGVRQLIRTHWLCHPGFNSRTPGGVRQFTVYDSANPRKFQFTHPGRGATGKWSLS